MSAETRFPPWVVLHVPHDATDVPASVRDQFLLDDVELAVELGRMTDHRTLELFTDMHSVRQAIRAPASRLVVDVERFADDADEPMAGRGMGAIYTVTSQLAPLRRPLTQAERHALMRDYYLPHHARLEAAVHASVARYGRCLVIDCHSFPDRPLPYEMRDCAIPRPDICIGTDPFHTDAALTTAFVRQFEHAGWRTRLNDPFAGALVPTASYQRDARVMAIMVEVNRRLYLQGDGGESLPGFAGVARLVRECCVQAVNACGLD